MAASVTGTDLNSKPSRPARTRRTLLRDITGGAVFAVERQTQWAIAKAEDGFESLDDVFVVQIGTGVAGCRAALERVEAADRRLGWGLFVYDPETANWWEAARAPKGATID